MKCRSSTTVGFRVVEKEGGSPLPVNSEVLDTSNFDEDTTRETLTKNDPKCRRVLNQKRWFEPNVIIVVRLCVTLRNDPNFGCCKNV